MEDQADVDLFEPDVYVPEVPSDDRIREAARMIAEAKNPLLYAGGGAISSNASEALAALAEFLQSPVLMTAEGKGAVSDRHYLSLGGMNFRNDPYMQRMKAHDLVVLVGTRNAYPGFLSQKVIQIDIDPEEIGRNYDDTFGLIGDARHTLEKLRGALTAISHPRESRRSEMDAARAEREESDPKLEPQHSLTKAIRNAVPDDGIVISGMTQIGYYSRVNYPVYEPRTYLTSSYYGNLGYAYPVALGAKVAQPDKAVVAISGDGGFMFASQEMATAVKYGINAIVVVFNDSAYGNVLRDQVTRFEGRSIGAELHNPDFMKLADAYGMRGVRVEGADALESALKESLAIEAPTLLEVPVSMMPNPFT